MMVTNSDIAKMKGWRPITYQGVGKGNGLWTKWVTPEHDTEITLPDWTGNIADAWTLVEEMPEGTRVWRTKKHWLCAKINGVWRTGATAPQAIVKAYMAWKGA
jgi:hypothetical protein